MAYKITYGIERKMNVYRLGGRFALLTLGFFLLFAMVAWKLFPAQLDALRQILLSHTDVNSLLQDLQNGQSITDAVTAFCQEILNEKR